MITRREFLKGTGLFVTAFSSKLSFAQSGETDSREELSFGIVTDTHYANTDPNGTRHYRESITKMTECIELMNERKVNFLIELGDFKDQGKPASEKTTLEYLDIIEKLYGHFNGPRYHVLGNHDVDSISKQQFLSHIENTGIIEKSAYYSFDLKGFHFVVLDANYKTDESDYDHGNFQWTDANIPSRQLDWLKNDLAQSSNPAIVFVHQLLDVESNDGIQNAAETRQILQDSKKVIAVFQGHRHPGHYSQIEGIHYYTLKAMIEGSGEKNNSYAVVTIKNNSIIIEGYRKATGRILE